MKDSDCSFTILRFLIQSVYEGLVSKDYDRGKCTELASEMCKYVQKACQLHSTFKQDQPTQSRIHELEWLFRITWNAAVYVSAEGLDSAIGYAFFTAVEDLYELLIDPEHVFTQNLISR